MCRNCAGFDDKDDVWGAAFAHRDSKAAAAKPAAPVDRQAAPAQEPKPLSRDQTHA